jgi:NAD(P)-dependent dehydrogenase (short-subunit alcohol dehydrogenase family)
MTPRLKPIDEQVIVVTGGSSGIGLATALAAAARGATLVLAARTAEGLAAAERQVEAVGGRVVTISADVGSRCDVQRIAGEALGRFGRIDTWVNNAGRSIFGALRSVDDADHRRLFETNFWGTVYGSLVAVDSLKDSGGALINLGSVASEVALPMQGMYSASKHAVRGFTDALRVEVQHAGFPISITLIKPAAINTPFVEHSKNVTDHEFHLPPPVYAPEEVAQAILHAATNPIREINVGGAGRILEVLREVWPTASDWTGRNYLIPQQVGQPRPRFSLRPSNQTGNVTGRHPGHVMKTSLYTRAVLHPLVTAGIVAAVGAVTAHLLNRTGRT